MCHAGGAEILRTAGFFTTEKSMAHGCANMHLVYPVKIYLLSRERRVQIAPWRCAGGSVEFQICCRQSGPNLCEFAANPCVSSLLTLVVSSLLTLVVSSLLTLVLSSLLTLVVSSLLTLVVSSLLTLVESRPLPSLIGRGPALTLLQPCSPPPPT
jgi:hypothetical protein